MLMRLSGLVIPALIFYIVLNGVLNKIDVYDAFVKGAMEGLKTVVTVLPTLVGLMIGVGVLRASGFLTMLAGLFGGLAERAGIGPEFMPLVFIKMFSSSAATGLVLDIFEEYGPDSRTGLLTSIMMSCTETCFYTMSVYYMAAKVKRTRWTLPGALLATGVGIVASIVMVSGM